MRVLVTTIVALNPGDAAILQGTRILVERAFGKDARMAAADRRADTSRRLYPWMRFVASPFGGASRGPIGRWISGLGYEHRLRRIDPLRLRLVARLVQFKLGGLARLWASHETVLAVREYLDADLILASGGTYLVPVYSLDAPLQDYEFSLWLNKPLGFMPQSMGPFVGLPLEERFRKAFQSARFVFVRDRQSSDHLEQLGIRKEHVHIIPDAAFALMPRSPRVSRKHPATSLHVAISVREWSHFPMKAAEDGMTAYFQSLAKVVEWLVRDMGATVTFLSSCQGIPEYWTDDSRAATGVVAVLDPEVARKVRIDSQFREPSALMGALGEFDLVIATRMHVAILSLCAGVPVVPIAYEFKTKQLFDSLGLQALVTDIETLTADGLRDRVGLLLAHADQFAALTTAGLDRIEQQLEKIPEVLRSTAKDPAPR